MEENVESYKKLVMKRYLCLLLVLILMMGCENTKATYHEISSKEAKQYIDNGAVLIDVRTSSEYQNYHINGAINMPSNTILTNISKQYPDKNTTIIVYCASGSRSKTVANNLVRLGYTKVYDLGSIDNWI